MTMAMESYRVRKPFNWDGWYFAPKGPNGECKCECAENGFKCTEQVGSDCPCANTSCHCSCGIQSDRYAGDIWFVMEGHPRKSTMLESRFATGDPSIGNTDELLKEDRYSRLLNPYVGPKSSNGRSKRTGVAASRS